MKHSVEVHAHHRAPYMRQTWFVMITDTESGEKFKCGHSHKTEALAIKCQQKELKELEN